MDANWMQDNELSNISKDKLMLINSFLTDTSRMSQKEMMMFIMNVVKKCKEDHIMMEEKHHLYVQMLIVII